MESGSRSRGLAVGEESGSRSRGVGKHLSPLLNSLILSTLAPPSQHRNGASYTDLNAPKAHDTAELLFGSPKARVVHTITFTYFFLNMQRRSHEATVTQRRSRKEMKASPISYFRNIAQLYSISSADVRKWVWPILGLIGRWRKTYIPCTLVYQIDGPPRVLIFHIFAHPPPLAY